jgi:hypothetical protein
VDKLITFDDEDDSTWLLAAVERQESCRLLAVGEMTEKACTKAVERPRGRFNFSTEIRLNKNIASTTGLYFICAEVIGATECEMREELRLVSCVVSLLHHRHEVWVGNLNCSARGY